MFKKSIIMVFSLLLTGIVFSGETEKVELKLSDLLASPAKYLNQTVSTEGTVDHVCKHGGKKMVIFASTPEEGLHVMASDTVPVFSAEINGSNVHVVGVFKENRITKAQVLEMLAEREAAEAKGNAKPSVEKGEGFGHGEGAGEHHEEAAQPGKHPLLVEMEASGKDYVSSYYIDCIEFNVVK